MEDHLLTTLNCGACPLLVFTLDCQLCKERDCFCQSLWPYKLALSITDGGNEQMSVNDCSNCEIPQEYT